MTLKISSLVALKISSLVTLMCLYRTPTHHTHDAADALCVGICVLSAVHFATVVTRGAGTEQWDVLSGKTSYPPPKKKTQKKVMLVARGKRSMLRAPCFFEGYRKRCMLAANWTPTVVHVNCTINALCQTKCLLSLGSSYAQCTAAS